MFEHLLEPYQASPGETIEHLELHQLAYDFKQEQHHREAFSAYCCEYAEMAQKHREEHAEMQSELDLFSYFWRKRRTS